MMKNSNNNLLFIYEMSDTAVAKLIFTHTFCTLEAAIPYLQKKLFSINLIDFCETNHPRMGLP